MLLECVNNTGILHEILTAGKVYEGVWDNDDGGWNIRVCDDGSPGWFEGNRFRPHEFRSSSVGSGLFDDTTTMVEDANSHGKKGQKIARFELIPPEALSELAVMYGKGAGKYEDRNWEKGYSFSLSFGAMLRHAYRWFRGEDFDPETGVHHMAAVAFHAFALMTFQKRGVGTDDRPTKENPAT